MDESEKEKRICNIAPTGAATTKNNSGNDYKLF